MLRQNISFYSLFYKEMAPGTDKLPSITRRNFFTRNKTTETVVGACHGQRCGQASAAGLQNLHLIITTYKQHFLIRQTWVIGVRLRCNSLVTVVREFDSSGCWRFSPLISVVWANFRLPDHTLPPCHSYPATNPLFTATDCTQLRQCVIKGNKSIIISFKLLSFGSGTIKDQNLIKRRPSSLYGCTR